MSISPDTSAGTVDRIEALERLGRLRAEGLLTEEEFAQEKARVLGAEPVSIGGLAGAATPVEGSQSLGVMRAGRQREVAPDDNDLLAPIRPISGDVYASFLTRKVWAAFAALVGAEFISVCARVFQLLNGEGWSSVVSLPAGLALSGAYLAVVVLALWGLSRWVAKRASKVGAVVLVVLAVSALLTAILRPVSEGLWVKLGAIALESFALWFLVGVVRGAFALQGRRPLQLGALEGEASLSPGAAMAGREAAAPIKRIISAIALGWLALFVIGGGWFWWSTRSEEDPLKTHAEGGAPTSQSVNTMAAPTPSEAPTIPATRERLVGVWAPQGQPCVGWGVYDLREDGQVLADAADGQWRVSFSNLALLIRTYDMDTDQPGPVEDVGGFVEMVDHDQFRLIRNGEATTYTRCS